MNRINNILLKGFLLLMLVTGWGGDAFAQKIYPTFDTSGTTLGASHWYFITFINKGANQKAFARTSDSKFRYDASTPDNNYKWRFVGTETDFIIQSASGHYVYNPASGTGNNTEYQVTTNVSNATHFKLINGSDADSWAFQRISNGGGTGNCMNPRNGDVREWSNDGGCRIRLAATEIEIFRWTVNIISSDGIDVSSYKVKYNGAEYPSGTEFELPPGVTLDGYTFQTTCNDKFVWGPVVDRATSSVNFDVRSTATTLTSGKFYQMVLRDKSGQVYNGSVQSTSSMVSSLNTFNTIRHKGQYIYAITAGVTDWTVELTGIYNTVRESATYVYVDAVSGSNVSIKMQNGQHVNRNGEGVASATIPLVYQSGTKSFKWNSNALPWNNLRNSKVGIGNTSRASNGNMEFFFHELDLAEYTLSVYDQNDNPVPASLVSYKHDNGLAMDGKLYIPSSKTEFTAADFLSSHHIENVTVSGSIILLRIHLPIVLHRQSHLFTKLESTPMAQRPGEGFIKEGEGMTKNRFTNDDIQYTSNYRITQYIKHGQSKQLFMPTIDGNNSEVTAYQRWYDYKEESLPRTDVINIPGYRASAGEYLNGYVVGSNNSRGDVIKNASANLPGDLSEYYLAVDQSRYNDGRNESNGDLTEPSLTMRVIYHLIDAKVMADSLSKCVEGSDNWVEEHVISFPNRKLWNGNNNTKSGVDYVGLNHEFSNYWTFDGRGTGDANLEQLVNGKLVVELDPSSTAQLQNVKMLASGDAGIGGVQGFERNRFIGFQYPASKVVPENSEAIIKVYMRNAAGTKFQIARIKLTFIGNAEPLLLDEVYGRDSEGNFKSSRSKEAMEATYGKPISELTFDHPEYLTFTCPNGNNSEAYAFPLDFKQSSYAYHGAPWASRGEYIFRNGGNIGKKDFYPIDSYKDAIDSNSSVPARKQGKYFLYVDASEQPGQVMSIPIPERLCVGSRMFCYGWFNSATQISQESVGIVINIVGKLRENDEEGEVIYSYNPGLLSTRAFDSTNNMVETILGAAPWRQVGFSFTIDSRMAGRYAAYEMQVMNNCYSTNGGDYTLDNFCIFVNPPKGNVDFTTPLCTDALRHVKVHTDYDMLLQTSGVNTSVPGANIPVSFCFLNKEVYDEMTKDYYEVDVEGKRTLKDGIDYDDAAVKNVFNTAFGEALIGERSIDKNVKGHGFHNFTVPVDYNSLESYAYNDSPDDYIFKEEKDNGERRIVFKEQLYQSNGAAHNWEPGKSYYLLFSPYHVTNAHLVAHDVGTEMFHIADQCCVLTTFSIMPPIEVKGDATITSSDQVRACDNQIVTFKVDMPALKLNDDETSVSDAVISGLNYDWWIGTSKANATHSGFLSATFGTYATVEEARRYNHKSVDDYPNDADVDRNVYLESALENIRFYFPEARTLDEVSLVGYDNENGYGIVAEHLACVAHYLTPMSDGRKPLSLFGQTFNLKVSHAEADINNKQHFVAIPILPEQQYGVDEKLIYCPAPQELIIEVGPTAPNMQNGFGDMTYPDHIVNVPIRIGKQQVDGVRKEAAANVVGNTLNIPLRKIIVTGSNSTELIAKDHATERFGSIFLTATDDAHYSFDTDGGEFRMRRVAQVIDIHAPKGATAEAYLKIAFTNDFTIHEGCTYTLKLPYVEDEECECEGTLVFDIKVVPEYQVWTGAAGNSDWTNDANWARADRDELHAGMSATGSKMSGATRLDDVSSYASNTTNTTARSFVPMYFTNVLLKQNGADASELYKGGGFLRPLAGTRFLEGLEATATPFIKYEMEVTPVNAADRTAFNYNCNYTCELFDTYLANGITFEPGTQLGNAHFLAYNKAWVECELEADRWYTLASPLKSSFAGDWYSPTDGGKQMTPHFYDINYREDVNDRFRPAYYQRSWDRGGNNVVYEKSGDTYDSYVKADWSYVYNDAAVNYSAGGFSVKAELDYMQSGDRPADGKVLVRLPKADTSYTYYDVNGETGNAADASVGTRAQSYRLLSDDLRADGSGSIAMSVSNQTADNNFLLLSNPFMAAMDMDEFFAGNPDLEEKYWIVSADRQLVSVKTAANGEWITTGAVGGKYVAPMQGFFVKKKDSAPNQNSLNASYDASMQTVVNTTPTTHAPSLLARTRGAETEEPKASIIRLVAERNGASSVAVIALNESAMDTFVAGEDCETFIDGNIYDKPTVYTSSGSVAQTINVRKSLDMVPVGMVSSDDSETTLRFDLSAAQIGGSKLFLYDGETDSYTEIEDGAEVAMSGNTAGRYFLTTSIEDVNDALRNDTVKKGVWTISGVFCGESVEGLMPGVYVVDGVKMYVR